MKLKIILIFVRSCVLAELFSDGHPPFDLSHLLSYRNNPKDEQNLKFLNEIEEPAIKVIFFYYDAQRMIQYVKFIALKLRYEN